MLTFRKRGKTRTDLADFRRWTAVDAPVAVIEIVGRYDGRRRVLAVTTVRETGNEVVIGRHRTKKAAMRTCDRFIKNCS